MQRTLQSCWWFALPFPLPSAVCSVSTATDCLSCRWLAFLGFLVYLAVLSSLVFFSKFLSTTIYLQSFVLIVTSHFDIDIATSSFCLYFVHSVLSFIDRSFPMFGPRLSVCYCQFLSALLAHILLYSFPPFYSLHLFLTSNLSLYYLIFHFPFLDNKPLHTVYTFVPSSIGKLLPGLLHSSFPVHSSVLFATEYLL